MRPHAGSHPGFIPAPLPPKLTVTSTLMIALSRADAALGEVAGLTHSGAVPRLHMLIQTFARREAVWSSRVEGTQTQLDELLLAEVSNRRGSGDEDLREVQNHVRSLYEGIELLKSLPLATRLVLRLHAILMDGVRGAEKTPGEFRKIQNFIGRTGDTIETAKYVPPPPGELNALLANWENFTNQREQLPDLIQCAIMHEQFEAIHPFGDGNGRIGRLLITLFLIERKRLPQPLLPLSAFIENHRADYYESLQLVRTKGDWIGWIRFFLEAVTQTARQTIQQVQALEQLRKAYREKLVGKHRARSLLDELFANPFVTASNAAKRLKVTGPTAQKSIDLLHSVGILEESTGRTWGRVFVARSILKTLENPPEISDLSNAPQDHPWD